MKKYLKFLYQRIPFKKEAFSILRIFPISRKIYQHLYFKGVISVKVNPSKSFKIFHYGHRIENEIFWSGLFGNWEKESMKLWVQLCANSKVIFDLGANTGIYSLVAKSVNPHSEVHAFEPFGAICEKLKKNSNLNGFNIQSNCTAISNYTGDALIYTENPEFAYSVTINKNLWAKGENVTVLKVKTITLKDYIEQNTIKQIDLMKIDVETHEPEVMEGFSNYLLKFRPIILIEILTDEVAEKLNKYFSPESFSFYNIHEKNGILRSDRLTRSDDFNYLIVPIDKELETLRLLGIQILNKRKKN